jgi:hypothetical protein
LHSDIKLVVLEKENLHGGFIMVPMSPGFWESLLRPISSNTAVTPTLAIIKLVTPLGLILATFAKQPFVGEMLFYLAASPVVVALLQIAGLTLFAPSRLSSEPHVEEMARIDHTRITQNNDDGSHTQVARVSNRTQDNPLVDGGLNPHLILPNGSDT